MKGAVLSENWSASISGNGCRLRGPFRLGVALDEGLRDHLRRSLGRVAARRALQACHILTIEGRGYRQRFLGSAA